MATDHLGSIAWLVRAPMLASIGDARSRARQLALVSGSTAEVAIFGALAAAGNPPYSDVLGDRVGVYWRGVADIDCTIAFGPAGMDVPVIGDDWPLYANSPQEFFVSPGETAVFRVTAGAVGNLIFYCG